MLDITEAPPAAPDPVRPRAQRSPRAAWQRVVSIVRANKALAALVAAGCVLRIFAMIAYWPAFGIWDDTKNYMLGAQTWVPDPIRPFGYSIFLWPFWLVRQTWLISLAQHALVVGTAVALYAFLRRRGIRKGWATAAVALPLLDARLIGVEHYVMSDVVFIATVVAALLLLLWWQPAPAWAAALSGALLGYAAVTRTIGLVILPLPVLFLLARRVRWHRVALLGLTMALPIGGYMFWYQHHHGVLAMTQVQGRFLWSRTTTFVDCTRTDFTPQEKAICPSPAIGTRQPPDDYVWGYDDEHLATRYPDITDDKVFGDFARKAILGQPVDYLKTIAKDTVHMAQLRRPAQPRTVCMTGRWDLPHRNEGDCPAQLIADGYVVAYAGPGGSPGTTASLLLNNYGNMYTVPPVVYLHIGLFGLLLALWRLRRDPRVALESLLIGGTGIVLLVGAIATSAIDPRYGLPMLMLAPVAAVLAASGRWTGAKEAAG